MGKMHQSTFQYLRPSDEQVETMTVVRRAFERIYAHVDALVPEGRYKALTITALEQAAMWANKGITRESDGAPRPSATIPGTPI
jgi:hypothetical protein